MLSSFLLVELIDVDLRGVMSLLLLLLNFLHQLVDLLLETFLEFLLHFGVLLQLGGCRDDGLLKLLSCVLVLMGDVLVLSKIFLKVIEDLKFLVQGNQRIKLMLKLLFLLLKQYLQLGITALLEHCVSEALMLSSTAINR